MSTDVTMQELELESAELLPQPGNPVLLQSHPAAAATRA